ncbi:MAG: DUF2218 domain-containing protein [Novosphingobium sp.]|nr:DUF2218 domain-containing protein [Novosphingobium sp.]
MGAQIIRAVVPTTSASRYLQQLCKHWSHKFETEFDAAMGRIELPFGRLEMAAGGDALTLTLHPAEGADVERFKDVVASHLDRFAFREAPLAYGWSAAGAG